MKYKYNGYYPIGAEKLATMRDELRKQGVFDEADKMRGDFPRLFGVDVLDTSFGYTFQWHDFSRVDP